MFGAGKGRGRRVNPFSPQPQTGGVGIYAADVFRAVIERERHRCDRNHHVFALVVFAMAPEWRDKVPAQFLETLPHLVRCTDEVGWLDDTRVGVMLPETQAHGAWQFSQKVREAMRTLGVPIVSEVFAYPSPTDSHASSSSDPRQLCFAQVMESAVKDSRPDPAETNVIGFGFHRYRPAGETSLGREWEAVFSNLSDFLCRRRPVWKRVFDITGAVAGLILLAPLMLLIALVIRLQSPGPVIFRQKRIGYGGRPFYCWKFRTMYANAPESVHKQHLAKLIRSQAPLTKLDQKDDPRLIPAGRLLRLSGLDELPQLFNVLRGEMSLVGPRPCIPYEYNEFQPWHRRRTEIMPGLTGLWQVSGKNETTFNEMVRLDLAYIRHNSLGLDLLIALRTIPVLIGQVYHGLARRVRRYPFKPAHMRHLGRPFAWAVVRQNDARLPDVPPQS
mgnify:CR=1 FL=1